MKPPPTLPVIFTAFSNPRGDLANLTPEQNGIQDALGPLEARGKIKHLLRTDTDLNACFDFLKRWENQIALFHYAGHANSESLSLQNADTFFKPLAEELLARNPESLLLVFLNGCSTRAHVQTLFDLGAPAVIATAADIGDHQAMQFALRFYRNLAEGDSIEAAYKSAANYIRGGSAEARFRHLGEIQIWRGVLPVEELGSAFPWGLYVREGVSLQNTSIIIKSAIVLRVNKDSLTLEIDGNKTEILRRLNALQEMLEKQQVNNIQIAGNIYNIGSITNANFEFLLGQTESDKTLPADLAQNILTTDYPWVKSLNRELRKQGVAVTDDDPLAIFEYYGWLIGDSLRKMLTDPARETSLRKLSLMTEAFQNSLRYLCYIQAAQLLGLNQTPPVKALTVLLRHNEKDHIRHDFLNLLLLLTEWIPQSKAFMPQINDLVQEVSGIEGKLYDTVLFLNNNRAQLINGVIPENDTLEPLIDEYLTALVYWLRNIAFLAKYRLTSIKDIGIDYRLGTPKNYVHLYGELHALYKEKEKGTQSTEYKSYVITDDFTFNQSVLLFSGSDMKTNFDRIHNEVMYISLSPLIIDYSVFALSVKQTPEIMYFTGTRGNQFVFAHYRNELPLDENVEKSNKQIIVKENNRHDKLDELFEDMERLFKPFTMPAL